jgi:hypothetical protein
MKKLLHEPLVHFLLLGLLVFTGFKLFSRTETSEPGTIIVTQAQVNSLVTGFTRTWQRPPTQRELEGLIREHIREEICTREAIALGLDRDDTIIRRRLRQKLEFLSDSIASHTEPTDEQLQQYLEAHPDNYRSEWRFTFSQIYLDPQKHGKDLTRDINQLLTELRLAPNKPDVWNTSDSLLLEPNYEAIAGSEVSKQFGAEFAAKLIHLPVGQWTGPIASGYGVHLVLLTDREEGAMPQLREVREAVKRDWVNYQRSETNEKFYQALLKRYSVTVEDAQLAFVGQDLK